jgi:hypothetical protein
MLAAASSHSPRPLLTENRYGGIEQFSGRMLFPDKAVGEGRGGGVEAAPDRLRDRKHGARPDRGVSAAVDCRAGVWSEIS